MGIRFWTKAAYLYFSPLLVSKNVFSTKVLVYYVYDSFTFILFSVPLYAFGISDLWILFSVNAHYFYKPMWTFVFVHSRYLIKRYFSHIIRITALHRFQYVSCLCTYVTNTPLYIYSYYVIYRHISIFILNFNFDLCFHKTTSDILWLFMTNYSYDLILIFNATFFNVISELFIHLEFI